MSVEEPLFFLIESAQSGDTLYACFYRMSCVDIAEAFNDATDRGVSVYFITDDDYGNTGAYSMLDSTNVMMGNSSNFMHNKFLVLKSSAVWVSSANLTENGLLNENNNALLIYSRELADVYEREFLHMWEGNFSGDKDLDEHTPARVTVDGVDIEVNFSPYVTATHNSSSLIERLIDSASDSVFFSIFTFSFNETRIKNALRRARLRGVEVKGVVDSSQGTSRETRRRLIKDGMDILLDGNPYNLHHKFAVIDHGTEDALVITGSYNWTPDANSVHDENFLVIHSTAVASLYWQEFQNNYSVAVGGEATRGDSAVDDVIVYPSPARDTEKVTLGYTLSSAVSEVEVRVYTLSGEEVISISPGFYPGADNEIIWDLKNSSGNSVAGGLYFLKVTATTGDGDFSETEKFAVIR